MRGDSRAGHRGWPGTRRRTASDADRLPYAATSLRRSAPSVSPARGAGPAGGGPGGWAGFFGPPGRRRPRGGGGGGAPAPGGGAGAGGPPPGARGGGGARGRPPAVARRLPLPSRQPGQGPPPG